MHIPCHASSSLNRTVTSSSKINPKTIGKSGQRIEIARRNLLIPLLVIAVSTIPDSTESQKALLEEYLKRSRENKAKNDKERLDSYYKRNYQDYFGFIEGSVKDKKEDELTEAEKGILDWLKKNK